MNFKDIHIGELIAIKVKENEIPVERILKNFEHHTVIQTIQIKKSDIKKVTAFFVILLAKKCQQSTSPIRGFIIN